MKTQSNKERKSIRDGKGEERERERERERVRRRQVK
jgi:hypothetical protein